MMSQVTGVQRQPLLLWAMTSTMVLLVLDSSIVGVMLPTMAQELDLTTVGRAWIVSVYLLSLAVLLPLGGKVADAVGPVRTFMAGMAGFTAASAGIASADSETTLIVWRALAGAAAAMLMPSTMSILTTAYSGPARVRAMAVYMGVGQGFSTIGPAIGGVCAEFAGWRWGFLVNVPVGVLGLLLVWRSKPDNAHTAVRNWDVVGACLLIPGLTTLVLALLQAPVWGWSSWVTWGCLAASVACLTVFGIRSRGSVNGLIDLSLFRSREFTGGTAVLFGVGFVTTAATIYGAIALQESLRLPPAASGFALLPLVVPLLVATRWVARRYGRLGARRVGTAGCVSETVGLGVVATGFAADQLWIVSVGMVFAGVGIGLLMSPLTTTTMSAAPADRRGQASGLVSTCRQLGGIIGVATFSALTVSAPADPGGTVVPGVVIGFAVSALLMAVAAVVAARLLPGAARCPGGMAGNTCRPAEDRSGGS